jgi:ABC-2 type transport system permease protein
MRSVVFACPTTLLGNALGIVLPFQLEGAVLGMPLPLSQSVLLIWPHLTGLVAATLLLFALAYVLFQRREIRA